MFFKNECLSQSGVNFVAIFIQLRHHSQNYYNNNKTRFDPHHPNQFMINPFKTNHDNQFLFRKNYLGLQKSTETSASPQHSNNIHFQSLQRRNPFTSNSPIIQTRTNIINSPQRPVSASKNFNNLSQSRYLSGKGGILEEADGWRREFQKKQREKIQIYGAQGLRYNAYLGSPRQRIENSDYYQLPQKRQESKYQITNLKPSFNNQKNNQISDSYYLSPTEKHPIKQHQKSKKELFYDEIYQQSPNFNIIDPRKPQRNQLSDSSRHSKIKDMFQSEFQDRFKQSMNYGSIYGGNYQQVQLKNKGLYNSSRFADSKVYRRPIDSQLRRVDVIAPDSLNVGGRIYYKVPV